MATAYTPTQIFWFRKKKRAWSALKTEAKKQGIPTDVLLSEISRSFGLPAVIILFHMERAMVRGKAKYLTLAMEGNEDGKYSFVARRCAANNHHSWALATR